MKKLFLLFFISLNLVSQDIDEAYLESLPEGVRNDVLERVEAKEELEEPVYRAASSKIDKKEEEKQSKLERWALKDKDIFGQKFFDTMQTSFMPINEPNLDDSYTLDFGDVLEVQLIGQKDSIDTYTVKRDGSINVPDIGNVSLSGLSLKDASALIKAKVKNGFIGTEAFVSLKNIRDINILITGNAYNPGIYTLNGNSNILHALSMAGGINNNGSFREINLVRNGKIIHSLDLYDLFIFGKSSTPIRLRTGDSIVISPQKILVNIISGVRRPSYYEMKDGENLSDLVSFANGLNSESDSSTIKLERVIKDKISTKSLSYNDLKNYTVLNNDTLIIREYKFGTIKIHGAVKVPGEYKISEGDTLSKIIIRAGGYEDYAYPFGGFLNNERSLEINKAAKTRLYNSFLRNMIENPGLSTQSSLESLPLILEELRNTPDTGRVIAEFDIDAISSKPNLDTLLEDRDEIIIPAITQQVYVYGEVNNTGAIRYSPNQDFLYYIENSGGVLSSADEKTIFVVHPNGMTQNVTLNNRKKIFSINQKNIAIYPGSIIYVPRTADIGNTIQIASVWAPIISSLALSIASISSLGSN